MKVGEIFTVERIVMGGTGYRYAPVRLTGEVALLSSELIPVEPGKCGAPEIQRFTFQFLRPGEAEIQLARFRSFELDTAIFEDVMPFRVELASSDAIVMPGGRSPFVELTEEDRKVFKEAMVGVLGADYTPEKVSKQIVHGTNYYFFCYGNPVTSEPGKFPAIVRIYAPLPGEGEVKVTKIERVLL